MKAIFKYPLRVCNDVQIIAIFKGAKITSACYQSPGCISVFAEVNPKQDLEERRFKAFLTGDFLPRDAVYVDHIEDGYDTRHLYEIFE